MRIGVYLGGWSLTRLGGMGVYLKNLLGGAVEASAGAHEILLLVDRNNRTAAAELDPELPVVEMIRPSWDEIPREERRDVLRVRRQSFLSPESADALRSRDWSAASEAYLWGLDDAVAAAAVDVLYFTIPPYLKCPRVPFLLTLHDLKHLHRPQDHDPADLARRRRWRHIASRAAVVYASCEHVRGDIVERLGIPRERTAALPLATPADLLDGEDAASPTGLSLPPRFGLMPAQFWPHKNHARVIEALSMLRRERGLDLPVICTGQTEGECAAHAHAMRRLADQLGVDDLFITTGHVSRGELRALYRAARFVLVATLYDPGSFPAMEALALGRPLVASRVTSIPETVGDAAILFDPGRVDELADAIELLWTNDAQCAVLSRRGPRRIAPRSWADVGRDWLALCERAAASSPLLSVGAS